MPNFTRTTRPGRVIGCPCGHDMTAPWECITRTPLPIADLGPCTTACWGYDLPQLRRLAEELGCCPCTVGATA